MFSITSSKATATPGPSGWAQAYDFVPEDQNILKIKGRLFVIVGTKKSQDNVETVLEGRELLGNLYNDYFNDLDDKPFNSLKNATEKMALEFKQKWGDVEIATVAIVDNVVFSAATGGAKIVISRDGSLATILQSFNSDVVTASGYPKVGDHIILGTDVFYKNVSEIEIKSAISTNDLKGAADSFEPIIHSGEDKGNLGLIIIKFDEPGVEDSFLPTQNIKKEDSTYNLPDIQTNFKQKLLSLVSNLSKKFPQKHIYIRSSMNDEVVSQDKKVTFSVGVVLLIILAISIGFGIRQRAINKTKSQYQDILKSAGDEVDQAINLASVSPDKSRELFVDSEKKLKTIEALKVKDSKIDELKQKIESSRASVLGEYASSPELFLDLSLLSSGFKGDEITATGGNIFILDKSGKKVVSVAISTKKSKVVAGPNVIDVAQNMASYEDRLFILFDDGVYEVGNTKNKVIDKTWDGEALIKAFAGNIYVLDKSANAIYRYAGNGNSFGEKQNWLATSANANFGSARQWVIDGSVYVLMPNSKVLKYSLGSPQSFKLNGVIPEIGSIDAIFASDETQYVYFLDKAGKRVVVTDKKGVYKAQYMADEIGNATNLVVSEAEKKIILLTGEKLFSVDIRHL